MSEPADRPRRRHVRVGGPELMRPREVAEIFRVEPNTVSRWAREGRLPCVKTPAGHCRFPRAAVMALLRPETKS